MQSQYSSVGKVKKREILLLSKKLHYSRSTRINKFTSEIIGKWGVCNSLFVPNKQYSFFYSYFLSKIKYASCKQWLLLNMCVYKCYLICVQYVLIKLLVPNGRTYLFITKEY